MQDPFWTWLERAAVYAESRPFEYQREWEFLQLNAVVANRIIARARRESNPVQPLVREFDLQRELPRDSWHVERALADEDDAASRWLAAHDPTTPEDELECRLLASPFVEGWRLDELRECVRRGPTPRRLLERRRALAAAVYELKASRHAVADLLGCSLRTIDRLREEGEEVRGSFVTPAEAERIASVAAERAVEETLERLTGSLLEVLHGAKRVVREDPLPSLFAGNIASLADARKRRPG